MRILKFGTSHCGMCQTVGRRLTDAGINYEDVDCEKSPVLAQTYNIRSVPVVVVQTENGLYTYKGQIEITKAIPDMKRLQDGEIAEMPM